MAEYTIKLVDVAAEARERLGDLATTYFKNDEPDWRFVITDKHRKRLIMAPAASAKDVHSWLESSNVQPDVIAEYLRDDEPPV